MGLKQEQRCDSMDFDHLPQLHELDRFQRIVARDKSRIRNQNIDPVAVLHSKYDHRPSRHEVGQAVDFTTTSRDLVPVGREARVWPWVKEASRTAWMRRMERRECWWARTAWVDPCEGEGKLSRETKTRNSKGKGRGDRRGGGRGDALAPVSSSTTRAKTRTITTVLPTVTFITVLLLYSCVYKIMNNIEKAPISSPNIRQKCN